MSQFDTIIDDVAGRFGLDSAKASTLVRELLNYMMGSPGGFGGFINKIKSAGLSQDVGSWLGKTETPSLTSSQIEQTLGSGTIEAMARKAGIPSGIAAAALGYLTPKLVGKLTPNGVIGTGIPNSVSDFIRTAPSRAAYDLDEPIPAHMAAPKPVTASSGAWLPSILGLAALAGLGWYLFSHRAPDQMAATTPATTPARAPAATTGVGDRTSATPARLAISNDNGAVSISGTVKDQATRQTILDALKRTFGDSAIKGDIAVNPNAAPSPWLTNLPAALAQLKTPGVQAVFEDRTINLSGLSDAERDRLMNGLKSLYGPLGLTLASADPIMSYVADSTNKAAAALASLGSRFQTGDLLTILNQSIINFPTGSANVPDISRTLLQQAAGPMKQLPSGTVIEISGFTDNTGDSSANQQLSQQRAEAVKNTLVQFGVDPSMLVAKGYGSANPVASNETEEGRFKNRRISYQATSRSTTGSGR